MKHQHLHRPWRNPYKNTNIPPRSSSRHRGRRPSIHNLTFANVTALLSLFLTLLLWFTSPIADIIANVALSTVPLQSDVELGLQTWNQEMKYQYPPVYDRWNVGEIGSELIQGRATRTYCRTAADNPTICREQIETYPWSFRVVDSNQVNAFALPGGIICVTNGLLTSLDLTRGEIAALLGHEMGHVLHRHSQSQLLKKNLLHTILATLLNHISPEEQSIPYRSAAASSHVGEETMGDRLGHLLLQGTEFLGDMKFSRSNEYQADSVAWDLLASSREYDPRHVQNLLQKLWSLEGGRKDAGSGKTSWEMTHPGTADRIEALQAKWESSSQRRSR